MVILPRDMQDLIALGTLIQNFLKDTLALSLHPQKTSIKKWNDGIDFLGYIQFPYHTILRTKTKKRIFARISEKNRASYFGVTSHGRCFGIEACMRDILDIPERIIHESL